MIRFFSRPRKERGAVAIIVAALAVVLFGVAALGVDIATQIDRKHLLKNQLDAAATAAAYHLDAETDGIQKAAQYAIDYYTKNGPGALDPSKISFWCVVGRKLNGDNTPFTPAMVADYQIPSGGQTAGVCNPDAASSSTTWKMSDYTNRVRAWDGSHYAMTCNNTLCAVPCALNAGPSNNWSPGTSIANLLPITCNTIRVGAQADVPFNFAPVLGVDEGSTGAQIAVACKGVCGAIAPNPMDVVIVADRTLSMTMNPEGHDYRVDLADGIKGMLQVMTPEQQYVALGALGPSVGKRTDNPSLETKACTSSAKGLIYPINSASVASGGSWVPIPFHKDYSTVNAAGVKTLDNTNPLYKAITCLSQTDSTATTALQTSRTALASPLKSAARYVLNKTGENNNIAALGGAGRAGIPRKVIIFETDGQPWENATTGGSTSLDTTSDVFSNYNDSSTSSTTSTLDVIDGPVTNGSTGVSPTPPTSYTVSGSSKTYSLTYKTKTVTTVTGPTKTLYGGQQACKNFQAVATAAKNAGILLITVGYATSGLTCSSCNQEASSCNSPQTPQLAVSGSVTSNGSAWVSDVSPNACRDSSNGKDGSQAHPYGLLTSCKQNMTVTYSVPKKQSGTLTVQRGDDQVITSVLASAASSRDSGPVSDSNGCGSTTDIAAENSDGDFFFCAAKGQDMAPIFITALSQVSHGVRLMNLPN